MGKVPAWTAHSFYNLSPWTPSSPMYPTWTRPRGLILWNSLSLSLDFLRRPFYGRHLNLFVRGFVDNSQMFLRVHKCLHPVRSPTGYKGNWKFELKDSRGFMEGRSFSISPLLLSVLYPIGGSHRPEAGGMRRTTGGPNSSIFSGRTSRVSRGVRRGSMQVVRRRVTPYLIPSQHIVTSC